MADEAEPILSDLRVLEAGDGIPVAFCGKLLAGLGARVLKVEPPDGDSTRLMGPFAADDPHPEKSGTFLYLNTAKQSVVLDLEAASDRAAFSHLASSADVVIESFPPGKLTAL